MPTGLDDGFDSAQNRSVTWRHLLQQTSEWQGTLWGKPDSIDHNRNLGQSDLGFTDKGTPRPMRAPGSYWEYNDVRVNRLSLSLLRLFRRPLAAVLKDAVMAPIGASDTWQWQPYRNAWVEIDGVRMPSVPGGSHWGGGLWIGSRDHARLRSPDAAPRRLAGTEAPLGVLDRGDAPPLPDQPWLRPAVVAEYRAGTDGLRAGVELLGEGRGQQRDLDRPGARPRRGRALDRQGRTWSPSSA